MTAAPRRIDRASIEGRPIATVKVGVTPEAHLRIAAAAARNGETVDAWSRRALMRQLSLAPADPRQPADPDT